MVSNYPSDPRNASSIGNPATPQSGPGGTSGPGSGPYQSLSSPVSGQSGQASATPPSSGDQRRLATGMELSGGRYKIDKLAAAGGMCAVYRAIDTRFNRPCAVKEMLDEFQNEAERSQAVEWFSREATLLLDLNHPCIPRVRDFFVENNKHYLVMEFIEGRTLGEVMDKEGNVQGLNGARGVSEARARSWIQQVCSVLGYLHRQNPPIIFRDLKPSNIMVTDKDEIKLIDFGIARTFQSQRQATIIMTIGYAPPEQLHGMPEPRSDIYSLGATLHRVLTHHDAANNKPSIFSFPPIRALRPDISPAFEQVIMKALAPNLEQRWPNAADMERATINLPPITMQPPTVQVPPSELQRLSNPLTPSNVVSGPPIRTSVTGPAGQAITAALGYVNAGRLDEAYASVQQAFVLEPNNSLVHRTFGQIFARRKPPQADKAIEAYNRSLQLNSNDAETHKLVGDVSLFLRQQPLQAIPAYTQSLRLNPNDSEAHQRLGQCYQKTNQIEPALREFQEAARLAPKNAALHYEVGQLALHLNNFPIAERAFQEAARLTPSNAAYHYEVGQLAFRMNNLPVAESAFVQVLVLNPADHPTRFLLSQVYEREGKLEDAWRECNNVIGPMAANPAVQAMYQRLRSRLGR